MKTTYTSGPWKFTQWGETISINSSEYMGIAHVNPSGDYDKGIPSSQDVANARLITSSPELVEALMKIVDYAVSQETAHGMTYQNSKIAEIAREAIAKTGISYQ